MKLFINVNEAVYNRNEGGKIGAPQRELEVGAMTYSASDQLDGGIDEFKIYNRPLSLPEIAEAMNSTPGKKRTDAFLYVPFEGKIAPHEGGRTPHGSFRNVGARAIVHVLLYSRLGRKQRQGSSRLARRQFRLAKFLDNKKRKRSGI